MGHTDFAWECLWWVAMNGEISQWNSKGSFEMNIYGNTIRILREMCSCLPHLFMILFTAFGYSHQLWPRSVTCRILEISISSLLSCSPFWESWWNLELLHPKPEWAFEGAALSLVPTLLLLSAPWSHSVGLPACLPVNHLVAALVIVFS